MRLSGERGLYVTSGLLREGGQALVYRARDRRGRAVAVKLAREPGLLADELAGLSRFRDRPWLVPLLDHGRHQGAEFLVLPLFECDLGAWLKAHLGMERLVALEQAALAVCELHRADPDPGMTLVHRDIKPSNFLVRGEPPEVVLADLGAFKRRDVLDSDPHTLICTPQYAPLDQQLGLHGPLQASWDVHALGVAIYWGIAGRFPEAVQARAAALRPEGERLLALSRLPEPSPQQATDRERLRALPFAALVDPVPALTEADRALLRRALADAVGERDSEGRELLVAALTEALDADPARRTRSAAGLYAALRRLVEPVRPRAAPPPPPRWAWVALPAATVAILLFGTGVVAATWMGLPAPEAPVPAVVSLSPPRELARTAPAEPGPESAPVTPAPGPPHAAPSPVAAASPGATGSTSPVSPGPSKAPSPSAASAAASPAPAEAPAPPPEAGLAALGAGGPAAAPAPVTVSVRGSAGTTVAVDEHQGGGSRALGPGAHLVTCEGAGGTAAYELWVEADGQVRRRHLRGPDVATWNAERRALFCDFGG